MIRDILTNKWILGGVALLIIVGTGCILWYRYDMISFREYIGMMTPIDHKPTNEIESPSINQPSVNQNGNETVVTLNAIETPNEVIPATNTDDVKQEGTITAAPTETTEEKADNTLVSPFGLGPYPEIPAHWPKDIQHFPAPNKDIELIRRVCIALNNEGYNALGGTISNRIVYPNIENVVYIEWTETERTGKYISKVGGWPPAADEVWELIPSVEETEERNFTLDDMPSHIKAVPYSEAGIDPYTYLDLTP